MKLSNNFKENAIQAKELLLQQYEYNWTTSKINSNKENSLIRLSSDNRYAATYHGYFSHKNDKAVRDTHAMDARWPAWDGWRSREWCRSWQRRQNLAAEAEGRTQVRSLCSYANSLITSAGPRAGRGHLFCRKRSRATVARRVPGMLPTEQEARSRPALNGWCSISAEGTTTHVWLRPGRLVRYISTGRLRRYGPCYYPVHAIPFQWREERTQHTTRTVSWVCVTLINRRRSLFIFFLFLGSMCRPFQGYKCLYCLESRVHWLPGAVVVLWWVRPRIGIRFFNF
jgi:hypothetical protein